MHELGIAWLRAAKSRQPVRFPEWEALFLHVCNNDVGSDLDGSELRLMPITGFIIETDPLIRRNMAFLIVLTGYHRFMFLDNPGYERLFGPIDQMLKDRGWWDNRDALCTALDNGQWERDGEEIVTKMQSAASRVFMMNQIVKRQYGDDIFEKIDAERKPAAAGG